MTTPRIGVLVSALDIMTEGALTRALYSATKPPKPAPMPMAAAIVAAQEGT